MISVFDRARSLLGKHPGTWQSHCANLDMALEELESMPQDALPSLAQIAAALGNVIAAMKSGLEDPDRECERGLYRILAHLIHAAGGVEAVDEAIAASLARRYIAKAAAEGRSK